MSLTRRRFLQSTAGGGMLLAIPCGFASADPSSPPTVWPSAFLRIDPDDRITFVAPRVEMGQGAYTSLTMLLAEELEVGLDQIAIEAAPPDASLYSDPINGEQVTGTSATTMGFYDPLRQAGAVARILLVQAAAKRLSVDPTSCRADRGRVHHDASGRSVAYGDVAGEAAKLTPPSDIPLKDRKDFKLIGKSTHRLDSRDKVTGRAIYGIDMRLPGMKFATVAACPVFGGKLGAIDDAKARAIPGVIQVVRLPDAVAVIADSTAIALKGLAAVKIHWVDGPNAHLDSASIDRDLETALNRPGAVSVDTGNATAALKHAAKRVTATYQLPHLAHAPMEPMNCTAHVRKDGCDVWVGTQAPVRAQEAAAAAAGLPAASVKIHNQLIGGGFGRRLFVDHIAQAVSIARHVDVPVKLMWTREEDMRHDAYRPAYHDRLEAGLDDAGKPVAWVHTSAGQSVSARWDPTSVKNGLDSDAVDAGAGPYAFPAVRLAYVRRDVPHLPVGWWRGVGPTHNVFVVESFLDELAAVAGQDPIAYRRALLDQVPRARAVLDLAAEKAGWNGTSLGLRRGRGVSLLSSFGSFVAQVAEVSVTPDGEVKVDRVVCAVDCGRTVNPDGVQAQIEGGVIFGLTAALHGKITINKGRVVEGNFDTYRMARLADAPKIEVHRIDNDEAPGGIGEPGTATIAAAVTNAIFAATGKRVRRLPIDPETLKP